jgi:hypothetical protein
MCECDEWYQTQEKERVKPIGLTLITWQSSPPRSTSSCLNSTLVNCNLLVTLQRHNRYTICEHTSFRNSLFYVDVLKSHVGGGGVICCELGDIPTSIFFPMARQPLGGLGLLIIEVSWSHTSDTPHSVGLLWTSDQPVAETSTWQLTTLTRDRHPCPRRDSNPQSQ